MIRWLGYLRLRDELFLRAFFLALFVLATPLQLWAGSDMASPSNRLRRSDVNAGGSNDGTSATSKLTDSVGTLGGSTFSGSTAYFVYSGFSNLVSHPDSIEDLAVVPGINPDQMILTWTAPTAYGSSGTATSYSARTNSNPIVTELDFVNAAILPNPWMPQPPGTLELHMLSGLAANTTDRKSVV